MNRGCPVFREDVAMVKRPKAPRLQRRTNAYRSATVGAWDCHSIGERLTEACGWSDI